MRFNELSKDKQKEMTDFLNITFYLKEDELQALDKQIPMTKELFERCCDRLSEIGAEKRFFQLLLDYPDLMVKRADEIEKEIELSGIEYHEMTEEEIKQDFEELMARIERTKRSKYENHYKVNHHYIVDITYSSRLRYSVKFGF